MKVPAQLISDLKKYKEVQGIYLFGLCVRGEAGPLSDIDVCIIADGMTEKVKCDILGYSSDKVDLVFFGDLPLTIRARIVKEGKMLFGRNTRLLDDLAWRTMKEYFDFAPYRIRFIEDYLPGVSHV